MVPETELELLLLPVRRDGRTHVRALGSLAPLQVPYWLGEESMKSLSWNWSCRRCAISGPRKPKSRSRNFEAARANVCGTAFWFTAADAKSGRATAQTNATLTIGS